MKEEISKFLAWIKKWLWDNPVKIEKQKKEKTRAEEVAHAYEIIYYKGKPIQLEKSQIPYFHSLDGKTKKRMVNDFNIKIRKRQLVLQEIDGKKLYIKARGIDHKKHFTK